jgi:3-oxoacyl-(acyl-carrier-protein) synthase III
MSGIFIAGTGMYVPDQVVTNDGMAKIVETSDEWISQRTGIRERRFSSGEPNFYMGARAARQAVANAGVSPDEIDMIIGCTCTADYNYPSLACIIQDEIGAANAFCWDLNGACTGFIYALDVARLYFEAGKKNILVVSSEIMSKELDFSDRAACVLFGDGAAAALCQPSDGLYASYLRSEGSLGKNIVSVAMKPQGAFATDVDNPKYKKFEEFDGNAIRMVGREVYRFAVRAMPEALEGACKSAGVSLSDLDLVIPHQANLRIIEAAVKRLDIDMEKVYINIDRYANVSSACIPISLFELQAAGKLRRGQKIGLVGFGGGLTYGAIIMEW